VEAGDPIGDLAARIGCPGIGSDLLATALTHRSWCAETEGAVSNERLELLGDSVLGFVVADRLYRTHSELPEGGMAKARADVVSAPALAKLARRLDLGSALRLGKGEEASGGRDKDSLLADAFEALLGAIYLACGMEEARSWLVDLISGELETAAAVPGSQDFKTQLQERCVQERGELPRYQVLATGPDHAREYRATVALGGVVIGEGIGRSKKQAQQAAAETAWKSLGPS